MFGIIDFLGLIRRDIISNIDPNEMVILYFTIIARNSKMNSW